MLFTLQIAVGVCLGLWLFRFLATRSFHWSIPKLTVPRALSLCVTLWGVLWVAHLLLSIASAEP